jgi:hypothetical protein
MAVTEGCLNDAATWESSSVYDHATPLAWHGLDTAICTPPGEWPAAFASMVNPYAARWPKTLLLHAFMAQPLRRGPWAAAYGWLLEGCNAE